MSKRIDISGKRFKRLFVLSYHSNDGSGNSKWICKCDCGNIVIVRSSTLINGRTLSCGCYGTERRKEIRTTHGFSKVGMPEYESWKAMRGRCYNKNNEAYPDYGGRGIGVCKRWFKSFENFFADMGKKPSPQHTLDRYPNNDGNYEPSNCRWATKRQQAENTRRNRYVEYRGEFVLITRLAERLGISDDTIRNRIKKGWPIDKNKRNRNYYFNKTT